MSSCDIILYIIPLGGWGFLSESMRGGSILVTVTVIVYARGSTVIANIYYSQWYYIILVCNVFKYQIV